MRLLLAMVLSLGAAMAHGQAYPAKPVRLIIPFPPGGSNDVVGRVIGAQLGERLGQGVVVDNRAGGGGTIGINAAAKSPADGYTLLFVSVGYPVSIALGAMPVESLQWFVPVAAVGTGPSLLVVPTSLQVNSVQDLIALAKKRPGELNAGSAGVGSFQHLATELFRLTTGIDIVIIQYKGGGPALTDTIGGQVHMNIGSAVQNVPQVRAGKLRALGVTGARRFAGAPDLATLAEAGLPGYEVSGWSGLFAPAHTPRTAIDRLAAETAKILKDPALKDRFFAQGAEPAVKMPDEFAAFVDAEIRKWRQVAEATGMRAN
jgi:tripartite-type tricarboxylate transporter receptor subunit TctC